VARFARTVRSVELGVPPLPSLGPEKRLAARVRGRAGPGPGLGDARFDQRAGPPARGRAKKSSAPAEALGRSSGGFTSKLHAVVDALGNPLRLVVTPGQQADCTVAADLLAGLAVGAVLADKAYDTNAVVAAITRVGAAVVVPSKRSRRTARVLDRNLYADRNKVERFFNRLKQYRRLATRYDKSAASFLAFAHCAATFVWLL
jgi:transposase